MPSGKITFIKPQALRAHVGRRSRSDTVVLFRELFREHMTYPEFLCPPYLVRENILLQRFEVTLLIPGGDEDGLPSAVLQGT